MSCKLKQVVIDFRIIISLVLLRHFGKIAVDIAQKYESIDFAELRKAEKLHLKTKKAELDVNFLSNCKNLQVIPKFLCFCLPATDERYNS